jgi:hypothetical protein
VAEDREAGRAASMSPSSGLPQGHGILRVEVTLCPVPLCTTNGGTEARDSLSAATVRAGGAVDSEGGGTIRVPPSSSTRISRGGGRGVHRNRGRTDAAFVMTGERVEAKRRDSSHL